MNKTRYFVLSNRKKMSGADDNSRFWTHRGNDDCVTCFLNNGKKEKITGYTRSRIEGALRDKYWQEITEAEAALL